MEKGSHRPNRLAENSWGMISQSTVSKKVSRYIDFTGWTSMEGIRSDYVGSMVSMLYIVGSE